MSLAWLLDFGGGCRAAVGEQHQVHLMHAPAVIELALTPGHARHALLWNDQCIPVLDIGAWLSHGARTADRRYLGVYMVPGQRAGSVQFGGLWMAQPPQRCQVEDDMAAALPAQPARWSDITCSCFDAGSGAVPILDLALVFGAALAQASGPLRSPLRSTRESMPAA